MTDAATVVCIECGGRNRAGEDFCGECGAYLAWEAAEADGGADAAPPAAGEAAAAPASGGPHPHAQPQAQSPGTAAAPSLPAGDGAGPSPAPLPPASAGPGEPVTELRKPTAPVSPPRRRQPAPAPEPAPAAGDVICPQCGAGNRPERNFCRRCANPMRGARETRVSPQPVAGARPRGRSVRFPFTAVAVLLAILGGLFVAWLFRDPLIAFVQSILGVVFSTGT